MVSYDPKVIQESANWLYAQAAGQSVAYALILAMVVGSGAFAAYPGNVGAVAAGAVLGGLIGLFIGRVLSLSFRLRAQLALCQLRTEENTRQADRRAA